MKITLLFFLLASSLWAVDFETKVLPILKNSCVKCHEPHEKRGKPREAKAGLRLDSAFGIAQGGDNGSAVVPGKPEESPLYTLAALNPDDDDIMPPKGDTLTKKELETLKVWIESGADFGKWRGVNKSEPKWPMETLPEKDRKDLPKLPQKAIYDFKKLPFIVRPVAKNSPYLEVEWRGDGQKLRSMDLLPLTQYKDRVLRIDFQDLTLDMEAIKKISTLESLEVLNLTHCKLPSLKGLSKLSHLQKLNLYASNSSSQVKQSDWAKLDSFTPLGI